MSSNSFNNFAVHSYDANVWCNARSLKPYVECSHIRVQGNSLSTMYNSGVRDKVVRGGQLLNMSRCHQVRGAHLLRSRRLQPQWATAGHIHAVPSAALKIFGFESKSNFKSWSSATVYEKSPENIFCLHKRYIHTFYTGLSTSTFPQSILLKTTATMWKLTALQYTFTCTDNQYVYMYLYILTISIYTDNEYIYTIYINIYKYIDCQCIPRQLTCSTRACSISSTIFLHLSSSTSRYLQASLSFLQISVSLSVADFISTSKWEVISFFTAANERNRCDPRSKNIYLLSTAALWLSLKTTKSRTEPTRVSVSKQASVVNISGSIIQYRWDLV